jgi:hypothetical protein
MYADSVHTAYRELLKNHLGSAVFISDLAKKARVSISEMRQWINAEARAGRAILDVGHLASATPEQRAEAGISATKHGERSAARPQADAEKAAQAAVDALVQWGREQQ